MNEKMNEQGEEKYLAVDFSINLEIGSRNRDDIYRESLKEQFKKIQRKLKLYGKEEIEFEEFVRLCFPKIKVTYYVSAPSFRVVTTEYNGYKAICNMYIRPEKTIALSSIIPEELDIFFVGDFMTNRFTSFVIKGIELIDNSISKPIETEIRCNAICALKKSLGEAYYEFEEGKKYPLFLDNNTIINLTEKTCPVYELDDVISILDDWGDYIKFRRYYLKEQSKKNEKINKVELKKAYSISRSEYKKNVKDYSELLLDGIKSFEKRDEVILSENVENSTEIALIKVEISRKLSEINQNSLDDEKMSLYERELRKFSKDNVALSPIEAENIKNAKELKETLEKLEVVIKTKTGNGDKLFGSITSQDISDALKKQHKIEIDKRKIELKENIKSLCTLTVPVRVYPEIVATVKVSIEKE